MYTKKQKQIVEKNYTKIPHQFIEKLPFLDLRGSDLMILLYIWRKTLGFNKVSEYLSIKRIETATHFCQRTVIRCIHALVVKNVISIERNDNYWEHRPNKITIHDFTEWKFPMMVREYDDSIPEYAGEQQGEDHISEMTDTEKELQIEMMDEDEYGEEYKYEEEHMTWMSYVFEEEPPDSNVRCSSDNNDRGLLTKMAVRNTIPKETNIQKDRKPRPKDGFLFVCDSEDTPNPDNSQKALNADNATPPISDNEVKKGMTHYSPEEKKKFEVEKIIQDNWDTIQNTTVLKDYVNKGMPYEEWEWLLDNAIISRKCGR